MEDGDQLLKIISAAVHHAITRIQSIQSCDSATRIGLDIGGLVHRGIMGRLPCALNPGGPNNNQCRVEGCPPKTRNYEPPTNWNGS